MAGKITFKYLGLAALALWLGCMAAYLTFAIMFTTPTVQLLPEILLPVGVLALVSLVAGLLAPLQARSLALVTAFPSVAMAVLLSTEFEGRFEFGWVVVGIAAVAICLAAAQLACSVRKRGA